MIDTIYLDMDGVICDFDRRYFSIYGVNCRDDPNKNNWNEFVKERGFYKLETCTGFTSLIDKLYTFDVNVVILSCAGDRSDHNQVKKQKNDWLFDHNLGHLPAIFTRTKLEKSNYALPSTLLIDDSKKCVDPFKNKGGKAILHSTAKQTIVELNCLQEKGLLCALSLDQAA